MNPRNQDCLGLYLYGAGYMARDDNTLGLLTGSASPPHFCLSCPKRAECENEHEQRVREALPERAETFDRMMAEAQRRGFAPTLAAMLLARRGHDPFQAVAIDNFARGHGDRARKDGSLVR